MHSKVKKHEWDTHYAILLRKGIARCGGIFRVAPLQNEIAPKSFSNQNEKSSEKWSDKFEKRSEKSPNLSPVQSPL